MNKKLLGLIGIAGLAILTSCLGEELDDSSDINISNGETSAIISEPGESNATPTESKPLESGDVEGSFTTPELPITGLKFKRTHYEDCLKKNGPLTDNCFPSIGTPKMLVIPVNLKDSEATDANLKEIKTAFGGTSEECGWESLKSYYYKSSYGKLDIDIVFEDSWFKPKQTAAYYDTYTDSEDRYGSDIILDEVLEYYDSKYNYADFDYDKDGYIDSIWLVYNYDVDYEGESETYWAYTTWRDDEGKNKSNTTRDGVRADYYAWAGIDFMHEETESYDTTNIKIDAHTYIHETGHLLGLDDYYDYDDSIGSSTGLYAADMMDYNIGDHGAMNKLLLGWVDPIVVTGTESGSYDLKSFTDTGDFLILANHELTSIYDEFFIIEFYTNTGLNENDKPIMDDTAEAKGIRIIHVDAHICYDKDGNITFNDDESYSTGFKYDNTGTAKPFIEMLRADYSKTMEDYLYPESLYTKGMTFGTDVWKSFKTNDGKALFFNLTVNDITTDTAKITITLK